MRHTALVPFALVVAACSRSRPNESGPVSSVGARCLDCHANVTSAYRLTGMARATDEVRSGEFEGLEAVRDGDSGWSYALASDSAGPMVIERWKTGAQREVRVGFAIGAGLMDRSFVAEVGDLDWFAPLEVVNRGAERTAALAPGHSIRPGTRFTIPIAEECLACHTDLLPARDYPLNLRPVAGSWRPAGISCAACHGDVESHAAQHETGSGTDPIRVPGRADPIESLSLCARCHLQGDASVLLDPGARGIAPVGGDMLDHRAVFVAARADDEIGFVSQVERLVLSRCLVESHAAGRKPMTCVTCHDPHRSSFDPTERTIIRSRCDACHPGVKDCSLAPDRRANRDCVDCHMRKTTVFDVATVEIHDHWIRKAPVSRSPARALRTKESKDGTLAVFAWPGRARPSYADDPGLWMMALTSLGRRDLALSFVDREPGLDASRLPTYYHLRGTLLEDASRPSDAATAYERALALDPAQAETAVNLGALLGNLGRSKDALAYLDGVIREHPRAEGALRNRGLLKLSLGELGNFAADLEAAYAILPQAPVARALAQYYARSGRKDLSDLWERRRRELDPK